MRHTLVDLIIPLDLYLLVCNLLFWSGKHGAAVLFLASFAFTIADLRIQSSSIIKIEI